MRDELLNSIRSCVENGERLLDEGYDLGFREPPSSRYFLTMIAQEEFAKAFILFLVMDGIAHLNPAVLRAMKDHTCKQLVGMVMDYVIMHWEEVGGTKAGGLDELYLIIVRISFAVNFRLPDHVEVTVVPFSMTLKDCGGSIVAALQSSDGFGTQVGQ